MSSDTWRALVPPVWASSASVEPLEDDAAGEGVDPPERLDALAARLGEAKASAEVLQGGHAGGGNREGESSL